jgi:hypothetical protein
MLTCLGASKDTIDLIACTVIVRNKLILYDKSSVLSIFFHWWNEVKMNIHLLRGGHKQAGTETSIIYKDGPNEHTFT